MDRDGYAVSSYKPEKRGSEASQCSGRSVVHLFKAVIALIVAPIDEHGTVINAGAMLAPAFKAYVSRRKVSDGRPLPREIALGPVSAEDHGRAAIAVTVTTGFMLPCIANIKDTDGPHEIELGTADIDVRAILNKPECLVGGNEIMDLQGLGRSTAVRLVKGFKDAASAV